MEIEGHLATLLKQSGSDATVDQLTKFIYEKGSVISLGDFVVATFRHFPTRRRFVDIAARLAVLTDAWNYFPHQSARRQVSAELFAELQNNDCASLVVRARP